MSTHDRLQNSPVTTASEEASRVEVLNRFAIEAFQQLPIADLLLAKVIAGHGPHRDIWITSVDICPSRLASNLRFIDIERRIYYFLDDLVLPRTTRKAIENLIAEGIFVIIRLALLMRLAPTGGAYGAKNTRLKPSSIAGRIFSYWPYIIAKSIQRKATQIDQPGFLSCLTSDDVQQLRRNKNLRIELNRIDTLAALECWTDLPPYTDILRPIDPSGSAPPPVQENVPGKYQPIPDQYLEAFGPRNLWVIRELGPRLLSMLEDMATHLENLDWVGLSAGQITKIVIQNFIAQHLKEHPWLDHMGKPLQPNFPFIIHAMCKDKLQFPPCSWRQLKVLSATLQSAHLFLTLIATAGRIGEIDTLPRSCVITARDGKDYVRGWTYKLSDNLFGAPRQFPAPTVLVQALGQQTRLAEVWSRLPSGSIIDGLPKNRPAHNALWLSLGAAQLANAAKPLVKPDLALQMLAIRIGMDPKPGGINLHPHRLRKTIGRLAGIALFNAPTALKRLFGHKSIEMTLHYILCDKDIQTEAEAVLRELRIMNCAEALEEVREAIACGSPLPAHSGTAVSRLKGAVKEHEARLAVSGRSWQDGSAYDLAYLLTARGNGWRFVQKNIICAKTPGEPGLCLKNRGEPNISKCQPECDNRIVLALARRDVDEIVYAYMEVAAQALDDGQIEVFYYSIGQLLKELESFQDIKEKYLADPQLQSMLATYKELE